MLSLEQAIERLIAAVRPVGVEKIPIAEAPDRHLAEAVRAPHPLPLFDNSAMDGWAVRSADLAGASKERPVVLQNIARVPAGEFFEGNVGAGQCARIFTGSPLPAGVDAVVMQEDTRVENESVDVLDAVKPWENVRFRGEDVKENATLANAGEKVTAALAGLLAACGVAEVKAHRQARVAILATGNELRQPGEKPRPGEIFESNRLMIATLARQAGVIPVVKKVVRDDLEETVAAIRDAAQEDAIVTCGGASVGEFDFVKEAIGKIGGHLDFWRVAIKPGKPFLCGSVLEKPLFGLPGNPVSAFVTFVLLARPALLRLAGASDVSLPSSRAILGEDISNPGDRRHFVRVRVDREGIAQISGPQASHRLASLAAANALLDIPAETIWAKGRAVSVLRFS